MFGLNKYNGNHCIFRTCFISYSKYSINANPFNSIVKYKRSTYNVILSEKKLVEDNVGEMLTGFMTSVTMKRGF